MPRKEIVEIAEGLNFKWENGAWRNKLSNGAENEIQLGIFEKFYDAGQKNLIMDEGQYLYNAMINRVRFCEEHMNNTDNYFKMASRAELAYYKSVKDNFKLQFSFIDGVDEAIEKYKKLKEKYIEKKTE